ncbi:hypothetical protein [Micromonospora cremea]|uniref:Uncharacterized protein n=1 Tax=Micromonospora cremea TaxID=709881 RepID=A0A1N6AQA5_9ACTN|nr:hypothetical protein [Micromonospora cremea]SIN36209.1 hypothetical protein SAMN04489832_5935 [Micromonospora cremea]
MASEAPDYFQPEGGLVVTHLLIVRDVDRSPGRATSMSSPSPVQNSRTPI